MARGKRSKMSVAIEEIIGMYNIWAANTATETKMNTLQTWIHPMIKTSILQEETLHSRNKEAKHSK
jgi:ribosomal protein S5